MAGRTSHNKILSIKEQKSECQLNGTTAKKGEGLKEDGAQDRATRNGKIRTEDLTKVETKPKEEEN